MKKQKSKSQDSVARVTKAIDKKQTKLKDRLGKLDRRLSLAVEDREQITEAAASLRAEIQGVLDRVDTLEGADRETAGQLSALDARTLDVMASADQLKADEAALDERVREMLGTSEGVAARVEAVEHAMKTTDAQGAQFEDRSRHMELLAEEFREQAQDLEERLGNIEIDLENTRIASMAARVAQPMRPPGELQEGNGEALGNVVAFRKDDGGLGRPSRELPDDAASAYSALESRTETLEGLTRSLDDKINALASEGAELVKQADDLEHWEESLNARAEGQQAAIDDLMNRTHQLEQFAAGVPDEGDEVSTRLEDLALRLNQVEADHADLKQSQAHGVEALQGQGDALVSRTSGVEQSVDEMRAELERLGAQYSELDQAALIEELNTRVGELDQTAAALRVGGDEVSGSLDDLALRLNQVEVDHADLKQSQTRGVEALKDQGDTLDSRTAGVEQAVAEVRAELERLGTDYTEFEQIGQAEHDRLATAQDTLIAQIDEHDGVFGGLREADDVLAARAGSLESEVATLRASQEASSTTSAELSDTLGGLATGVTQLKERLGELAEAQESFLARTEALESGSVESQARYDDMAASLGEMGDATKALEEGASDFTQRLQDLADAQESTTTRTSDLEVARDELKGRQEEMTTDILGLADSSKTLEEGLTGLDGRTADLSAAGKQLDSELKDLTAGKQELEAKLLELVRTQRRQGRERTDLEGRHKKLRTGTSVAVALLTLGGAFIYWDLMQRDQSLQETVAAVDSETVRHEVAMQGTRISALASRVKEMSTVPVAAPPVEPSLPVEAQPEVEDLKAAFGETGQRLDQLAERQDAFARRIAEIGGVVEDVLSEPRGAVGPLASSAVAVPSAPPASAQDSGRFTVQLIGAHSRDAVAELARRHAGLGSMLQYRGRHQGRDWFVLLYGSYATWEEANQALADVPAELMAFEPWVREFAGLTPDTATLP